MKRPAVDVIIPTRNRLGSLRRALRSVFRQTFRDLAVTVVDDASTDGTAGAMRSLRASRRISYVRLPRSLGAAGARNVALRKTSAPYVAFLDSDDAWLPEKLEKQMHVLQTKSALVSHGRYIVVDGRGRGMKRPRFEDLSWAGHIGLKIFPRLSTCVMARKVFRSVGFFNPAFRVMDDDVELFDRIRRRFGARCFHFLDVPLATYRFDRRRWSHISRLRKRIASGRMTLRDWRGSHVERVLDRLCFVQKHPEAARAVGRRLRSRH